MFGTWPHHKFIYIFGRHINFTPTSSWSTNNAQVCLFSTRTTLTGRWRKVKAVCTEHSLFRSSHTRTSKLGLNVSLHCHIKLLVYLWHYVRLWIYLWCRVKMWLYYKFLITINCCALICRSVSKIFINSCIIFYKQTHQSRSIVHLQFLNWPPGLELSFLFASSCTLP